MLILGSKGCPYCEVLKKDLTKNKELSSLIEGKMNVYYIPIDEQKNFEIGDKTPSCKNYIFITKNAIWLSCNSYCSYV